MSKFDHTRLLKFLSKPRYVSEVAEHFHVSPEAANYQLREAIKCGQVLVSQKRVPQTFPNLSGRQQRLEGFLYVSEISPSLVRRKSELMDKVRRYTLRSRTDVVFVKYPPKTDDTVKQKMLRPKRLAPLFREGGPAQFAEGHCKSGRPLVSRAVNSLAARGKLIRPSSWRAKKLSAGGKARSLSHKDEICLFQALLDQPLSFLDIRGRFGVSKQTVKGFVERGFFEEEWGPGEIGVRYRLTEKGKNYLNFIEEASRLKPYGKNIFIRLKNLLFS